MTTLLDFLTSTLLNAVFVFFLAGTLFRGVVFIVNNFRGPRLRKPGSRHRLFTAFALALPFHRAAFSIPFYAAIRYAFHAAVFIVPIWFSGHIGLWEESRFEWSWTPIPDVWADGLTFLVLASCLFFIGRLFLFQKHGLSRSISGFALIFIGGMPFLTGYLLTHGSLDTIPFFEKYLWYFHVLSGEFMLIMVVFLFCRTHLKKETCVGCGACVENCPTETLEYEDEGAFRFFRYSHYQCVCCGFCVSVCPEGAAELRHEFSLKHLFQIFSRSLIRSTELEKCAECGKVVGPEAQMEKIRKVAGEQDIELETLALCSRCRKMKGNRMTSSENRQKPPVLVST